MVVFSDEEKIEAFDKIAELYYEKNFGSTSKADLDLLLFSEYIEHCINNGESFDDYTLSKNLGITQSRIRTLKEKKELKYPKKDFNWKNGLLQDLKNARYDEYSHCVKVLIQDVNVMLEFRNYVETKGWYDDYSLNKKICVIPIAGFVDIFSSEFDFKNDNEAKENLKKILKQNPNSVQNETTGFLKDFTKDGLKGLLMSASKEVIKLVLSNLPFGGVANMAIDVLCKAISG